MGGEIAVALKTVRVKAGALRPGFGMGFKVPETAFRAVVGRTQVDVHDLDGDGAIVPELDGLSLPGFPFVVPLPATLLLENGQFELAFEGVKRMRLRPTKWDLPPKLVADAAFFTELRIRCGLQPVVLDPALCNACAKHCDYLALHGLNDGSAGMATHDEDPKKAGYTEDGARAGRTSSIGFKESVRDALSGSFCTAWHGCPMIDAGLRTFGVAAKHGVTLICFGDRDHAARDVPQPFPADGSTHVPRSFSGAGEEPNPVPGTQFGRGCGMPIYLRNAYALGELRSVVVMDLRGKALAGALSCPQRPANPEWPTNSGLALFIPLSPLMANTTYSVRFEFASDSVSWVFRTGD